MKASMLLIIILWSAVFCGVACAEGSFFDLSATSIDGKSTPLSAYKGNVLLVVNTASNCGFTPQYEGLEKLYRKYKERGFTVMGFPSNDFLGQEPGTNDEVKQFCESKYDVTFPLFSKDKVTGKAKQPVYQYLTEKSGEKYQGEVLWNFEKFLVDRQGQIQGRFRSPVKPESETIVQQIETLLAKQ